MINWVGKKYDVLNRGFILLFIFIFSASFLFSQTNNLEGYQVITFNGVTRLSFTFTQRPITNIMKEANANRLTITVPNCGISGVAANFTTTDMFARSIAVSRQNRDLSIVITTSQPFEIRQSGTQARQYIVHVDMFRSQNPREVADFVSMIDFFNHIGNRERVNELLFTAQHMFPHSQEIINRAQNRFAPPRTFTPPRAQAATPQRPAQPQTSTPQRPTQPAQQQVQTPPVVSPQTPVTPPVPVTSTQPPAPTELPGTTTENEVGHDQMSFTLASRNDRFPTRIPQTRALDRQGAAHSSQHPNAAESEPIREEPIQVVDTPPEVPITITPPTPEPEPPTQHRIAMETGELVESANLLLGFHNIASIDSVRTAYMIGVNAHLVGDYETAIRFLRTIPSADIFYLDAVRLLHDSFINVGDTRNAAFYASILANDTTPENVDFMNTPIQLWIALLVGFMTLIIGIVIASLVKGAKKSKSKELPDKTFDVHKRNLQRAYDNKKMTGKDEVPKPAPVTKVEETIIGDNYDDPPLFAEELDSEEEKELIKEERLITPKPPEPKPAPSKLFEPEPESESVSYSDDTYRKNLILKLYNDGWKTENIAKELQMSQREIEFTIKMNE